MINILVVEDNDRLRQLMKIHLCNAGYVVYEAEDGEAALTVLDKVSIHLIIVDIMMPKMDGYELTGELRGANYTLPVLMVTAKETLDDKKLGFRTGADDYMVKPVDFEELLLRVKALLRRSKIVTEHLLRFGDSVLDADSLSIQSAGALITLREKEFGVLQMLLSYPNKIFTRQIIMDEIWGYDSETDPRTVDVHIKRIREKLSACKDFEIQTIRGLGYKAVIKA